MGGAAGPEDSLMPGESAMLDAETPNPITGELGGQTLTPEATADIFGEAQPLPRTGPRNPYPSLPGRRSVTRKMTSKGPSISETVSPGYGYEDVIKELMKQPMFISADAKTKAEMVREAMRFVNDPAALDRALGGGLPGERSGMVPTDSGDDLGL